MRDNQRKDRNTGLRRSDVRAAAAIVKLASFLVVAGWAVFGFSAAASAQQSDDSAQQCLAEVRETMVREQIKQLDARMRQSVAELCELGNTPRATAMVMAVGAFQRCTRGVDAHIADNNLDVAKDVRSQAYGVCRGGDLKQALQVVAGSPTKEPAGEAEIVSFAASSGQVKKGGSVTLSWQTSNATLIMLARIDPSNKAGISDRRTVAASGSLPVTPDSTTTYVLMAANTSKGAAPMQSRKLEVQVSAPPSTCSISGTVTGVRRDQGFTLTHVGVFVPGEMTPKQTAPITFKGSKGFFSFKGLPGNQNFRVATIGGWRYDRRNEIVSCIGGKTHSVHFHILGMLVD